jgi:hypothetical protein
MFSLNSRTSIKPKIKASSGQIFKKGNFSTKHSYFGNGNHTKCKLQKISKTTVATAILFKTNHNQNKEISCKIQ